MLIVLLPLTFLRQWNVLNLLKTSIVSAKVGSVSGASSSRNNTTSLKATVMPPPVSGCRMFMASPSMHSPGVMFVFGGKKEFGMLRILPSSSAAAKAG